MLPGTVVAPPSPAGPHSSSVCPTVTLCGPSPGGAFYLSPSTYLYCTPSLSSAAAQSLHFPKARVGLERTSQGLLVLDKDRKLQRTCSYPRYNCSENYDQTPSFPIPSVAPGKPRGSFLSASTTQQLTARGLCGSARLKAQFLF